ncbi:unnamed protein product [Oreochromis niloticus]|nr:unnamed protein product [Mustela putorius furo]
MHEVAEEEHSVVLRCPLSEERRVTWSRERNDSREEILTADGGRLIRHDDITKQYTAYDDLSLYIYRAAVSHSGTYFCDNKAAVELTVIPSALIYKEAEEQQPITLPCPRPQGNVTWSRETEGRQVIILTVFNDGVMRHDDPGKHYYALVDKSLHIREAAVSDSGTYLCNNETAAELRVIPSDRKTTTTTSLTTRTAATAAEAPEEISAADHLCHMTVRTLIGLLCLIIMISITAVTWRKARQIQKQKRDTAAESDL